MTEFGCEGYVVFFGVLEIYSREFSPEIGWNLVVSWSFLHQKLRVSSPKVKKIIAKIYKWHVNDKGSQVSIYIPKFRELMDEWTLRKLGSYSGVTPEILSTDKDKDKDKDKEANCNLIGKQPVDNPEEEAPPFDSILPEPEEKVALKNEPKKEKPKGGNGEDYAELQSLVAQVKTKHPKFPIESWYGKNRRAHPEAILHVLRSLLKANDVDHETAYIQKALEVENGKYNARDYEREQEGKKGPTTRKGMATIGQILQGIGGRG